MNKFKKCLVSSLLIVMLGINAVDILPLDEQPGWNATKPMSESICEVEI